MQRASDSTDSNYSHQFDHRVIYGDGEIGYITVRLRLEKDAQGRTIKTHGANQDITERKQRERELEAIATMSAALRSAATHADMLSIILDQVMDWLKAESSGLVMKDTITGDNVHELARGKHADWVGMRRPPGRGVSHHVMATGQPYLVNDPHHDPLVHQPERLGEHEVIGWVPLIAQGTTIGALWVSSTSTITHSELRVLTAIADIAASAIRRAALHEETRKRAEQLAAVNRLGRALAEILDLAQIYEQCREAIFSLLPEIAGLFISAYAADTQLLHVLYGYRDQRQLSPGDITPFAWQNDPQDECIRTRQPVILNQAGAGLARDGSGTPDEAAVSPVQSALFAPMIVKGVVTGVIQVQGDQPNIFVENDASLLAFVANTAAIAIENARLFAETRKQLERLQALRTVDSAVTASLDLRVTLSILLEQVTTQLGVDASCILLLHPHTHSLEFNAGRGFRTQAIERTQLRVGEDFAGRAALDRRPVSIHNLATVGASFKRTALLTEEGFVAYYAVPLITKGSVKGVLEIYHRAPLVADFEWKGFAETLAGQAAIAIENVSLFNELQRSNTELTLAYDTTLEGWTRALDLRDKEIESHTQRVTEMSARLGRAMGLDDAQLLHLRRGALLHDIGNFGVPDSILHKPGPLTDEEWAIVRRHPEYAYNLLRPIPFLRQAIDIPYCHHERWDGSGYPRGLKGDSIPVAARIYAVVDVWEALRADRPYRPAWRPDQVRAYLAEQSGRLFDPQVVELFLKLFD
jgi:HD-GYP domain-containing protein (c-di-GMP phosphodiesterase class II)/putative methionine-R-sulfoxide reductase with GAF domain